jgi:predicted HAD superfamily Cof-like phosphohydrolase
MQQPDSINLVAEFHTTFKHPILTTPTIPNKQRCTLRVALLAEELKELEVGIANGDIVEIADALCDLQYVLSGAILEFGLGEKFKSLFEEVQRSNMSKACLNEAEAIETVAFYKQKDGTECYYKEEAGKWLVFRKNDNKTIKSINYSPADLDQFLK